ncbi:MAG: major facilitator superfamily 1 [Candidatus Krumholzibacteriota bacterium]|nr:major facilitator superfamily 1 [Candidatus Krumholzibacteriota bacterium]
MRFIILLGFVSLFADMTYEAARSASGPFLAMLGASATAVGVLAGLGELIGYGLRIVSGIVSDKTKRYWLITIVGYTVNLLAVPALALAGRWEVAAVLMMTERLGKALRNPARDAMLSHATQQVGRGWGFGLHEAMDQIGAMTGPMIVTIVLAWKGSYTYAFAALAFPALLALIVLAAARITYPHPETLESSAPSVRKAGFGPAFWLYVAAIGLVAAGFVDFPLAAFHVKKLGMMEDQWIPLIYSGAMGIDALTALVLGRMYDKKGLPVLLVAIAATAWFAPFVFSSNVGWMLAGMALWGIGLGAQESVVRAVVSEMVPADRRATGYGVFNTGFGIAWFAGSALMGFLYDRSIAAMVVFSIAAQIASLPLLYGVHKRLRARAEG